MGESTSPKGKFSPWFVSTLFGISLLFLTWYLSNSLLRATCYTFSLRVRCINSQMQHSLSTLDWSCTIPTHQLKDIPPTQFSYYLPCDPGRCMFSALLPSQERKDLLLFLMASDFFSSSGNCKSGGYRTSQYFLHSLSSLSLFFSQLGTSPPFTLSFCWVSLSPSF